MFDDGVFERQLCREKSFTHWIWLMTDFPTSARVVIIGGGVTGVCLAYHLAHNGWGPEVVRLEKVELTSGSAWHAAGQISHSTSSFGLGKCVDCNIGLYSGGLEAETRQAVTWRGPWRDFSSARRQPIGRPNAGRGELVVLLRHANRHRLGPRLNAGIGAVDGSRCCRYLHARL